jgi:hypothetical protein
MIDSPMAAIVQSDIKASGNCNHHLLQESVRVTAATRPTGDIIEIVDSSDIEGYLIVAFGEGEIPTWVSYNWKVNRAT